MQKFKSLIKISLFTVFSIVLLFSVFNSDDLHRKYIRSIAEESSVKIVSVTGRGTGFHVQLPSGKVVILTNKHVCEMNEVLNVESFGARFGIVRKVIKKSDRHDLCVMEGIPGKKGISIGSDPTLGDILYTLGHPRGEELNVASGEYFGNTVIQMVEQPKNGEPCRGITQEEPMFGIPGFFPVSLCIVEKNTFHLSTPTYPGNSGSAVVNKYGNLVAVIFAGNAYVENNGYAVPLEYIKDFLNTL